MLARMPPTLRWPLMDSMLCDFASATNRASSSSLPVTKGTFMSERSATVAVPLNSLLWSR